MEKNTVLLSLDEYQDLIDFKRKIEEGKTYSRTHNWNSYGGGYTTTYYTESEVVEKLNLVIKELENKNFDLETKNIQLQKEITINDLKKMSYWEFRKWRKLK